MIFMTSWTALRLDKDDLWLVQENYNWWFIKHLWILFHGLYETFAKETCNKTFLEMPMGSHLANRMWSCYLENWDSSGVNNHLAHFWSHLKLSSEKRLTDAQYFLYLFYSGLRHHFALDVIVFLVNWYWQLDFKWTKTKFFVFIMHSKPNYG